MFASTEFIHMMVKCDELFGDGTFKQAPNHWYQLYTIHGYFKGQMFPMVYFILPNKFQTTYIRMLTILKNKVAELTQQQLRPQLFQVDFEIPVINAIEKVIGCQVKGCAFHFTQCLFRKVQSLGFVNEYNKLDSPARLLVRKCMALHLLPPNMVVQAYNDLIKEIPSNYRLKTKCESFIDYMNKTWIGLENTPTFNLNMWNQWNTFQDRTNNRVEGWHSGFNKHHSPHPNIFNFINHLVDVQQKNMLAALAYFMSSPAAGEKFFWRLFYFFALFSKGPSDTGANQLRAK